MNPLYMKDAVLTVAANDFAAEVSSVQFQPSAATATWKGLKPTAVHTHTSTATWQCAITLAQDYDDANSLARYLLEHEGAQVAVHFEPKTGGMGIDATVTITPGAIGGAVDSFADTSVTLGVDGKPALTPPAAP